MEVMGRHPKDVWDLSAKKRKLLRNALRRKAYKEALSFKVALGPVSRSMPPKICNRVSNCVWESGGSTCECEKWPQWLADNCRQMGRAEPATNFVPNMSIDALTMSIKSTKGTVVSYYRPSGKKGFHFYKGIVRGAWSVKFPTGCRREVVAVISHASLASHEIDRHFVCPTLDVLRPPSYDWDVREITARQRHAQRLLQDPNELLFPEGRTESVHGTEEGATASSRYFNGYIAGK